MPPSLEKVDPQEGGGLAYCSSRPGGRLLTDQRLSHQVFLATRNAVLEASSATFLSRSALSFAATDICSNDNPARGGDILVSRDVPPSPTVCVQASVPAFARVCCLRLTKSSHNTETLVLSLGDWMLEPDMMTASGPLGPGGFLIQLPPASDRLQGSYLEWRLIMIYIWLFSLKLM